MLDLFRKCICTALVVLVSMPTAGAQQPATAPAAPVPPQVLSARTVFVSNGGAVSYFEIFTGGPDRPYNTFYADLQQSNRYRLVSSPSQADVIFEIHGIAPSVSENDTASYNPELILRIIDPQTRAVLWTTSANVRAFGTKARRDRGLDQAVAVLVDKLSQVTGQPLSPEEIKAVHNNSRMSTGVKVFIVVSIAATAAFAAWGIYRVTHPPKLPPLPTPTFP